MNVSRLAAGAAAAVLVSLVCPPPNILASPAPGAVRAADVQARAVVTHGPGTPAAGRNAMRPGRGPDVIPHLAVSSATPATSSPSAAISATLNQEGLRANGFTPSDSTGAIGPLHYIEVVNSQVGLFTRSLTSLSTVNLGAFIGATAGANVGDPQVQWDQQAGRWLYVSLELYSTGDKLAFGWSKRGDTAALTLANTDWCNFHLDTSTSIHDYPKLGHDANFMLIGADVYANGSTFTTGIIWAIPKPAAGDATCTPPTASGFGTGANPLRHLPPDSSLVFTPVPANTADSASTGYIVAIDLSYIGVWHVSLVGCVLPPCLVADGEVAISPWSPAPLGTDFMVPQPGGGPTIDALDGRVTQAVQVKDPQAGASAVWTQHTIQGAGGRTIVTWYELIPAACAGGVCGPAARRQEGVLSDPNLWLFNAAISPASNGNAAFIHYNTGSLTSFVDARAQGRSLADPRNVMSGEVVLRSSTVADTDFSCSGPFGPPCRWGDYAGASPDPVSCSTAWGTTMLSGDAASTGPPTWVTQNFAITEGRVRSAVSTQQYALNSSDGRTWSDMDGTRLRLGSVPCGDSNGLITANVDLFTSVAGVNQDVGIFVDIDGVVSTTPVTWKESGGFNGTFSPNAAYAQAVIPMLTGHTYEVRLKWKANIPNSGTIYAGAGPLPAEGYSPTRLTLELFPAAPLETRMTTQPKNTGSDGVTWSPIPGLSPLTLFAAAAARVVLGGNADLFTDTAGYNQDLGITLNGALIAWKESGGFGGTLSPNAAFVQASMNLTGGQTYLAQLAWKSNLKTPAGASIYVGAGPLPGSTTAFSPTSLTAILLPAGPNPYELVTTQQRSLAGSDGSTWTDLGVQATLTAPASTAAIVSANVDLWTATAGFNQDIAVFVSDNGGAPKLLAWKESGGFGGTYSPSAAVVETVHSTVVGHTYVFSLKWKTNRNTAGSGATIYAGAGPIGSAFSPTRLLIDLVT